MTVMVLLHGALPNDDLRAAGKRAAREGRRQRSMKCCVSLMNVALHTHSVSSSSCYAPAGLAQMNE